MSEKPILFNTDMVKAILDGRKTQTRRPIKPKPPCALKMMKEGYHAGEWHLYCDSPMIDPTINSPWGAQYLPPFQPGDILWVRETWKQATTGTAGPGLIDLILYKADGPQDTTGMMVEDRWHPSIHMRRIDARLFLRVKDVRVERLQDMTTADAEKEGAETDDWLDMCEEAGVVGLHTWSLREYFGYHIWDRTINGEKNMNRYSWNANPWVWVIEFERMEK